MPEGPEIRRAADKIAKRIKGTKIIDVVFGLSTLENREAEVLGRVVERVEARGKALLIAFSKGPILYSHNQLYGKWVLCKTGKRPATGRQLRVALRTNTDYEALLYSASEIELLEACEISRHPYLSKLGPDVLNTGLEPLFARLQEKRFQRRSLGSLFLDQSFLSGTGNYLRTEILFFARLGAEATLGNLTEEQKTRLAHATHLICQRAYVQAGITVAGEEAQKLKNAKVPRYLYRHYAFGKGKRNCFYCGDSIRRSIHTGRRFYSCLNCQGG